MKLKTFKVKGYKIGLKTLKATEVSAITTMWGLANERNDFDAFEKVTAKLLEWVEVEVEGVWMKAYDPTTDKLIIKDIENAHYDPVFNTRVLGLLEPFIMRSEE